MNVAQDPLPRSLIPLPDESLPGFLLRLAHRLDLPPGQVARRTGLAHSPTARAPASHLLMLESAPLNAFAHSTRVTPAAADSLTLRPYTDRYPALTHALVREGSTPRPRSVFPPWLLMACSRYCPTCLAGDDTPIQRRHGGPWKREWRLAITFACLDHQVFLRNDCSRCRLPVFGGRGGRLTLLPAHTTPGLHPAQCRNPPAESSPAGSGVCGHWLDSAEPPEVSLSPALAGLQRRLVGLLTSEGQPEHAFQRFADLQVAAALIQAGWPAAADLAPSEAQPALAAHNAPQAHPDPSPKQALPPAGRPAKTAWSTPPGDAVATAALLAASEQLVTQDPYESGAALPQLLRYLPTRQDPQWGTTWRMLAHDASPSFRHQVEKVFQLKLHFDWIRQGAPTQNITKTRSAHRLFAPLLTLKDHGFAPEHIPQFLPEPWLAVFTDSFDRRTPQSRLLRRMLPIHLIQAISNLNLLEAAEFLGIPLSWSTGHRPRLNIRRPSDYLRGQAACDALERLAQHIARQRKIDYQARRTLLTGWHLDDQTWNRICRQHRRLTGPRPGALTRECASALVWSRVTGSEYSLAPIFQPPISPPNRQLDATSPAMLFLGRWDHENPPFPDVLEALEALALQIIEAFAHAP
ncbi:TniQ family protein [Streptomyces lydicus]|uniref:TniQ family protein n=1 Tax=Streptomyces lydicus TaxID=47763 RepID=UPI003318183D